jgi:hypothetical protein
MVAFGKSLSSLAVLPLLLVASTVRATILINDGAVNTIDTDLGDGVSIFDGPGGTTTTVNLVNGGVVHDRLIGNENSEINVSGGGTLQSVGPPGTAALGLYDQSSLTMTGGKVDGAIVGLESATATILGGSFGSILVGGSVVVDLFGGMPIAGSGVSGVTLMLGIGTGSSDDAVINVLGGQIGAINVVPTMQPQRGQFNIFGSKFMLDGTPVGPGPVTAPTGLLSGVLQSGEAFSSSFDQGDDGVSNINLVPEPGTGALFALGLVAIANRPRRMRKSHPSACRHG